MSVEPPLAEQLTNDQATVLLHIGLAGAARPIDALMDRLAEPQGDQWLASALRGQLSANEVHMLEDGSASETELAQIKGQAKRVLSQASAQNERLAALAVYCVTVARGLVSCDRLMSSRSSAEWAEVFADLAGVVPVQWRDLMSRAAESALRHSK